MTNSIQTFKSPEFGQVRTVTVQGEPWIVLRDVCEVLELTTPARVSERLDKDEVSQTHIIDSMGRTQETIIINESGLYSVILRSDKPKAKPFRKWVTSEVLPSIRRHGAYATDELLSNPDLAIAAFQALKDERERNKALQDTIRQDAPYTGFGKAIAANSDAILIGEFAKLVCNSGINIGRNRLFAWMRDNKYLMADNAPYQRYIDNGLFATKESSITTIKGDMIRHTTMITGKGQMVLLDKLQKAFGSADNKGGE